MHKNYTKIRGLWIYLTCIIMLFCMDAQLLGNPRCDNIVENADFAETRMRTFPGLDDHESASFVHMNTDMTADLSDEYFADTYPEKAWVDKLRDKAKSVFDRLEERENFIKILSGDKLVELPVGLKNTFGTDGAVEFTLAISRVKFTRWYGEVTAFIKMRIPQKDKDLYFCGEGIKVSYDGGIVGDARLYLMGDHPIPISGKKSSMVLLGGYDPQTGRGKDQTYAVIDCKGIKKVKIEADVVFSRSQLIPIDKEGNPVKDVNKKVTGHFETQVFDWNDMLVEMDLPDFTTPACKEFGFRVSGAVLDMSDLKNSSNIIFPEAYSKFLIPDNTNLWRGVFANEIKVILPKAFCSREKSHRISFGAQNLLIDSRGVSGMFYGDNIMSIDEGTTSKEKGWAFSLDRMGVQLEANKLTKAVFEGEIRLPISKEQDTLKYKGLISSHKDYQMVISAKSKLTFDLWKAEVNLAPNSFVVLKVKDDRFLPKACLNGNMELNVGGKEEKKDTLIHIKQIKFNRLQLQTEQPYIKADYFGYSDKVSLCGFPVTISEIYLKTGNNRAGLGFDISVNLMDKGFVGETKLAVIGTLTDNRGLASWRFKQLDLDKISLEGDIGAVRLEGMVEIMEDDPVYGNGFAGSLAAEIASIKVKAQAVFGHTEGFRYWCADALATFHPGPTVGPLEFNTFGGGVSYHMSQGKGNHSNVIPSGLAYKPDCEAGLGVRALVGYSLVNAERTLNGQSAYEIAFNRHLGVNRIAYYGEGHLMNKSKGFHEEELKDKLSQLVKNQPQTPEGNNTPKGNTDLVKSAKTVYPVDYSNMGVGLDAFMAIEMDFENKSLHGQFEMYINTPGNFLSGVGQDGRAGWAVFHASSEKWYLYIGTPQDRIGMRIGVGPICVKSGSYFMLGDDLPGSPPPPSQVSEILGLDAAMLDYMSDENALGLGRGVAFGSDLSMDTGDMKLLIFYARFMAGVGFDIMLKDYAEAHCKGKTKPVGINGWYANGQAYAYLQGELGIKIKLLFVNKRISIIKGSSAVLLQAKLPNPSWFRGYLSGRFKLLGGLVRGSFRFKVELGDQCEIVGESPLEGLTAIADITPRNDAFNVDVFASPQVVFNMKIDLPFSLDQGSQINTYRLKLENFQVLSDGGAALDGTIEWNDSHDVATFCSHEILPPQSKMVCKVSVSFEEKKNGVWEVITEDGTKATESREVIFTTGEAPDYIPLENVALAYPVVDQHYFMPGESSHGFVKLRKGQAYLFAENTITRAQFLDGNKQLTGSVTYDPSQRQLNMEIPSLKNICHYTMEIIQTPDSSDPDSNIEENYRDKEISQGNKIQVKERKAKSVVMSDTDQRLMEIKFATSKYDRFSQKMKAKKLNKAILGMIVSDVHFLEAEVDYTEPFEIIELEGNKYTGDCPLVSVEAVPVDLYYGQYIKPLIYNEYPLDGDIRVERDALKLGIPPVRGLDVLSWYESKIEDGQQSGLLFTRLPYKYNLPFYYKEDYLDLRHQVADRYCSNPSREKKYSYLLESKFPVIRGGEYRSLFQYVMPGGIKGSSWSFEYSNPYFKL